MNNIAVRLIGALPRRWVLAASSARLRYPALEPAMLWVSRRYFRHRDHVIQSGPGKGLRLNPGASSSSYVLGGSEPEVQRLLTSIIKPGMVVYDVGANVGFYSVIAARLAGPNGRVVSFEPSPDTATTLIRNARLNGFENMTIYTCALGSVETKAVLGVSELSVLNRLNTEERPEVYRRAEDIEVPVRTLDNLVSSGQIPPPGLIKIDVEGAEADVLTGALAVLREYQPIVLVELHDTRKPVADVLERAGYCGRGVEQDCGLEHCAVDAHVLCRPITKLAAETEKHSAQLP